MKRQYTTIGQPKQRPIDTEGGMIIRDTVRAREVAGGVRVSAGNCRPGHN